MTSYCCIASVAISALGIQIPHEIITPIKTIGSANTFLCMFVIGIALNFNINFSKIATILKMIGYRYGTAFVVATVLWFVCPFENEIKFIIVAICFAPITSLAPITAIRVLPEFAEDSANLNMVSIMVSVLVLTLLNTVGTMFLS